MCYQRTTATANVNLLAPLSPCMRFLTSGFFFYSPTWHSSFPFNLNTSSHLVVWRNHDLVLKLLTPFPVASHSAGKSSRSQWRLQADEARKDSTICDLQGRHANVPKPGFFIPQLQFTSLRMKGELMLYLFWANDTWWLVTNAVFN